MNVNDDDNYSGPDGDGVDGDGEGEGGEGGQTKRRTGPWQKSAGESNVPSSSQEQQEQEQQQQPAQPQAAKVYVSPALRQQQLKAVRLRKGVLPDINNEEFFPTLGDAKKEELRKKKNEPSFEEVKNGGRLTRSTDLPTNAPVSIGNRYNSLSDS